MPGGIWVILATGPSMSQAIADYVRGKAKVIAVSDAYRLAPWADALVSHDRSWWRYHDRDVHDFAGLKFCRFVLRERGIKSRPVVFNENLPDSCNSGRMAMEIAKKMGAEKIILCGFDMHGTHFFGHHPDRPRRYGNHCIILRRTSEQGRQRHLKQFSGWCGPPVINCTPGSALTDFPIAALEDTL